MIRSLKTALRNILFTISKKEPVVRYERIPGTDREMLIRTIRPDGTEFHTIALLFPPNFKP